MFLSECYGICFPLKQDLPMKVYPNTIQSNQTLLFINKTTETSKITHKTPEIDKKNNPNSGRI